MSFQEINLEQLVCSRTNSQVQRREHFDAGRLSELMESVAAHGILQPIIVRPKDEGFEIVAGERRFLAAQGANLQTIPATVLDLTDEQVIEIQLVENLQREDVHPMQEAEGYHELVHTYGHSIEDVFGKVGKSRSYVYGRMKLLDLTPKCRKALYAGKITESVGLLLARIPVPALQEQALEEVTPSWGAWSYREAKQHVEEHYMLRLDQAPFKTSDAELVPAAGACGLCPKRTGNARDLFGDVKSADVCTDPSCFDLKRRVAGDRALAAARTEGREVVTGAAAKKILPNGTRYPKDGYRRADDTELIGGKDVRISKLVGKDAPRVLVQTETGEAVELVAPETVRAALRERGVRTSTASNDDGSKARQRKAAVENKFRQTLYLKVRPSLPKPDLRELVSTLWSHMWHEHRTLIAKVCGWGESLDPARGDSRLKEREPIEQLSDARIAELAHDLIFVDELKVSTWSNHHDKPDRLLAAAKAAGVDAAALRREIAPNKKPAKKKTSRAKAKKSNHPGESHDR